MKFPTNTNRLKPIWRFLKLNSKAKLNKIVLRRFSLLKFFIDICCYDFFSLKFVIIPSVRVFKLSLSQPFGNKPVDILRCLIITIFFHSMILIQFCHTARQGLFCVILFCKNSFGCTILIIRNFRISRPNIVFRIQIAKCQI